MEDVSIYIPVYNGEKTIENCLNSVFKQSLKPSKILVINDCSTDNTKKILENYSSKIEIINLTENLGLSYVRDLAINKLETNYVAAIDADVELDEKWMEDLINSLKTKDVVLVGGKMYEKHLDNPCNSWRSYRIGQNLGEEDILNPKLIFGCNYIVNKKNLDTKNLFRNDHEFFKTNGEDSELAKELYSRNLNLFYNSKAICYHLQNDNYKTLASRYWRYMLYGDGLKKRNLFKTIKNILRQFKRILEWTLEDIRKSRYNLLIVNFCLLYYLIILDVKYYFKEKVNS